MKDQKLGIQTHPKNVFKKSESSKQCRIKYIFYPGKSIKISALPFCYAHNLAPPTKTSGASAPVRPPPRSGSGSKT